MCSFTAICPRVPPPPSLFFLPVIITNIPGRCSGTHPIGLGTKAGERLLKTCQSYLTWISQVLYKAKSSWAQEDRGWPGGHRHQHLPKAILQPGWGQRGQSCHCIHASTVKGIGRAQNCRHGPPRSGFSVRKNNLIIFCFFFSLVFHTFPIKEKDAEVKHNINNCHLSNVLTAQMVDYFNVWEMGLRRGPCGLDAERR